MCRGQSVQQSGIKIPQYKKQRNKYKGAKHVLRKIIQIDMNEQYFPGAPIDYSFHSHIPSAILHPATSLTIT